MIFISCCKNNSCEDWNIKNQNSNGAVLCGDGPYRWKVIAHYSDTTITYKASDYGLTDTYISIYDKDFFNNGSNTSPVRMILPLKSIYRYEIIKL